MLQAVIKFSIRRAGTVITTRRHLRPQTYASNIQYSQWPRRYANSPSFQNNKLVLSTLHPFNSVVVQEVLDLSGESEVLLTCEGRTDASVRMLYDADKRGFPPNTRGVFYYNHWRNGQHIRFRLCDSVADFERGTDLVKGNGKKWSLPLERLTKRLGRYRPLLDMIAKEHPPSAARINEEMSKRRTIMTLSPQHLAAKGQAVFDISNNKGIEPDFIATDGPALHRCAINYYGDGCTLFPAGSKGVFYYQQSATAPSTVGELRFRLCSDVASFATGSDMRLPSGLPWYISSDQNLSKPSYEAIFKQLLRDELIKEPLPLYTDASSVPVICNLNQHFLVDLSVIRKRVCFKPGPHSDISQVVSLYLFSFNPSLYTGRAVVQFEKYPSEYLDRRQLARQPLFALRFLEFLTPVEATLNVPSHSVVPPVVGELLMRKTPSGKYLPWGYTPRDETLHEQLSKLTEQSPAS